MNKEKICCAKDCNMLRPTCTFYCIHHHTEILSGKRIERKPFKSNNHDPRTNREAQNAV